MSGGDRPADADGGVEELRFLPRTTALAWRAVAEAVPEGSYLAGGTAIAVHLNHRSSADLDFFLRAAIDLDALVERLEGIGTLAISSFDPEPGRQTLNVLFAQTKVQFLEASSLVMIEATSTVAGVQVAGLGDLLAMKLKVILDRGELRDYFDLLALERVGGRRVEEGIGLAITKYRPRAPGEWAASTVRALAYLDDVEEDPGVPMAKDEVSAYWSSRVPDITRHLSRYA